MRRFLSSNIYHALAFSLFIIIFICAKIDVLEVPLFWDELGVYGKGIFLLIENGISLHPNALDPEISRGHPLLFSNLIALFSKILGSGIFSLRLAALLISCLSLLSFFYIIKKHCTALTAFIACPLLASQAIFFTQSTMIIPEVLLGILWFWVVHFYLEKQFKFYFILGAALILTKETSSVLIGALILYDLAKHICNKEKFIYSSIVLFSPIIPFLIFLLIQKLTYGWYLFPYHSGGFDLGMVEVWNKLEAYVRFIFIEQARIWMLPVLLIALVFYFFKKQNNAFIIITTFCGFIYLLFGCTTFYLNRYVLVLVMSLVMISGHGLVFIFDHIHKSMFKNMTITLTSALLIYIMASYTLNSEAKASSFNYDEDMSYLIQIHSLKETVKYIESNKMHQDSLVVFFPVDFALADSKYGYTSNENEYKTTNKIDDGTTHMIIYNPPGFKPKSKDHSLRPIDEWSYKYCDTEVFKIE